MPFTPNAVGLQVSGKYNYNGTGRDAAADFGINDCAILAECASTNWQGNPINGVLGVLGNCDSGCGLAGIHGSLTSVYNGWSWNVILPNHPAGVLGTSNSGPGVHGASVGVGSYPFGDGGGTGVGAGVYGQGINYGVVGASPNLGVYGFAANDGIGAQGEADFGFGVVGIAGFFERPKDEVGVLGEARAGGWGVWGTSDRVDGTAGVFTNFHWKSPRRGVFGFQIGDAGYFHGNVNVVGFLSKSGGGFKIDDPRDPKNKCLCHSFVESSDMKNLYDGIARLDKKGEALVRLPDWFEVLNKDFRYQLTAIGAPAPDLHVAKEISKNCFVIAGGSAGMRVAWQVTGVRQDPWANQNRVRVEVPKVGKEKGSLLHPELHGESMKKSLLAARFPKQVELLIKGKGDLTKAGLREARHGKDKRSPAMKMKAPKRK